MYRFLLTVETKSTLLMYGLGCTCSCDQSHEGHAKSPLALPLNIVPYWSQWAISIHYTLSQEPRESLNMLIIILLLINMFKKYDNIIIKSASTEVGIHCLKPHQMESVLQYATLVA